MKLYNILAAGLVVASVAMTSCNDDDTTYAPGFEGVEGQVVIAPTVNASYKLIKIPGADIITPTVDWNIAPRTRIVATEPMTVKFEIDNSLVAAYNAENGTEYLTVPEGVVELTDANSVISVGKNSSDTIVGLQFTEDQTKLAELQLDVEYMVPVKLSEITKGEGRIGVSVSNVSYVTFTVNEVLLNPGGSAHGEFIPVGEGRSGWSMSTFGPTTTRYGSYWNPLNASSYWYLYVYTGGGVVIDLGKPYKFDGMWVQSGYGPNYYLLRSGVELEYSVDGTNYKIIGTLDRSTNVAAFYAPITAQYIRITCPYNILTAWTEFTIYEVQ